MQQKLTCELLLPVLPDLFTPV